MKYSLPPDHGLSDATVAKLVYRDGDNSALTDAQYEALASGVGRGADVLVVSPTSTGKTLIAMWAAVRGIETRANTVYLVTHRALAKQKFDDFKSTLVPDFLGGNLASIVIATGDYVENGEGDLPSDPLRAPVLVATYEKYLALLSASGIPADMKSTVLICDEIQLLGDANRGQNVEVLLTLVKNAGWKQFVGLSAVLNNRDAKELAGWLNVNLVAVPTREKHLRYECWTESRVTYVSTDRPDELQEMAGQLRVPVMTPFRC